MIQRKLYVIDISGLVYHAVTGAATYKAAANVGNGSIYNLPSDGIKEALDKITFALGEGSDVVVCFDSRNNFRKKIMPSYKSGRVPNREVFVQLDFLYEVLSTANVTCLKEDTYEADDLINWATQSLYKNYEEVIIMSGDMDISHNVHANIRLEPFVQSRPIIRESNFETSVKRGVKIMFNTISAHKLFFGDSSDSVPAFSAECKKKPAELYGIFLNILRSNGKTDYAYTTSKQVMEFVIGNVSFLTDKDREELLKRMKVIYPADKPENVEIKAKGKELLNKQFYVELLSMFGRYTGLKWLDASKVTPSTTLKDLAKDYAYRFNTGAYAVDNNLEVDPSYVVDSEMYFLNEF